VFFTIFRAIEATGLSVWIRESDSYFSFWLILSVHAIGMGVLVGASVVIGLRILGLAPDLPLAPLQRFYRFIWVGFWIQVASGLLLLIAYPTKSLTNPLFYVKLTLIGLAVAAVAGAGLGAVVIALVVATVPDVARVARGAAVGVMGQEFMEAGRAVGVSDRTLIWRYLTLNCISTIFVFLTLRFGQIILIGSALGFLGMGAQPPTAELGMMAAQGRDFLFMAPHIATIPSCAIFVIVLAANLLGDALRDVLDPRLQQ